MRGIKKLLVKFTFVIGSATTLEIKGQAATVGEGTFGDLLHHTDASPAVTDSKEISTALANGVWELDVEHHNYINLQFKVTRTVTSNTVACEVAGIEA